MLKVDKEPKEVKVFQEILEMSVLQVDKVLKDQQVLQV